MENVIKGYKIEQQIGKGVSSKVFLATRLKDGEKVAIKQIDKSYLQDKRYKKYINNEIFILKNINSEYTIKFYELMLDMNYLYLVFEYCNGGDLDKCLKLHIKKYEKAFSQEVVQHIMRQIIAGFVYLHTARILHRDIKLENILVQFPTEEDKENLNLMKAKFKITDFGFARYLKENKMAESVLGNAINMEPHILRKLARIDNDTSFGYDQKADIWSLGAITYELLIGCPAFEASSYDELITKIEKGEYRIPHEVSLSIEAICFLEGMLRYQPETRLDIESISKQYFLTRDISSFHNLSLIRTKRNLGDSIILNSKKDENSNLGELLSQFDEINVDIDANKTQDKDNFGNITKGKKILDEPIDYVDEGIKFRKFNTPLPNDDDDNKKNEKNIEKNMSDYLNNLFDEMNKDCFQVEPLLAPMQPTDNNYDTSDPITKFMDAL